MGDGFTANGAKDGVFPPAGTGRLPGAAFAGRMLAGRLLAGLMLAGLMLTGAACGGMSPKAMSGEAPREPADAPEQPSAREALPGAHVFADGELLQVHLELAPDTWRELEEHGNREEYLTAAARLETSEQPAVEFAQVGVRHKGSYSLHHCWDEFGGVRSYEGDCAKLSFKLKFDRHDAAARFDGLKRLNLHSASADPTKLHELLAYRTFRDFGVDAPRAVPAQLTVNGEFLGLFIAVEDVDGRYARAHFPDGADGNLYKEIWPHPLFSDEEFQAALETGREPADVSDMRAFAEAIAGATPQTFAGAVAPFVQIDALLRYIAVDRALRNWDGVTAFYSARSSHNFFWYHDDGPEARFHLIPWDLDQTFWAFHPYTDPQQWVTAPPLPDFNERPLHCELRPVWEAAGTERVMPPRCDRFLNLLAETHWPRLVDIGGELLAGPFAAARLQALADAAVAQIQPILERDPTLDVRDWQRAVREFSEIVGEAGPSFAAFLSQGLTDEASASAPELPPEGIDAVTLDAGLHVGAITNFEFAAPPAGPPAGVYVYGDPLATIAARWSTEQALSGAADLRFDFTFQRGPASYDEWAGIGIGNVESDVSSYSKIVAWMSADRPRDVRIRVNSPVYDEVFGGVLGEFGVDHHVDTTSRPFVIDFARLYYPSWAKDDWLEGQGFTGTDDEALRLVLQRFTGIIFGPAATVDTTGELSGETETGYLRIDNIYFR